jgi:membrane fusion protein (multidrug efflux system)
MIEYAASKVNEEFGNKTMNLRMGNKTVFFSRNKKHNALFVVLFFTLIVLLASCSEDVEEKNNSPKKALPVHVEKIVPRQVDEMLETFGVLQSFATVKISAEQQGAVTEIFVKEGDYVKVGQALLKCDDRIFRAEKEMSAAALKLAESTFSRQKSLYEAKSASAQNFEDAMFSLEKARADFDIASTRLDKCEIRSPIDGFLDELAVELGEYLSPLSFGTQIARIEKTDKVKLVFFIPEKDISFISAGKKSSYSFEAFPNEKFEGVISYVSKAADINTLGFRAEIEIPNPEAKFRPGMIADLSIIRRKIEGAIAIPIAAIVPRYGGHYVFVVGQDGLASQREVKIALFCGRDAVISEGLLPDETLVVEGNRFLREKDPLRIIPISKK